MSSNDPKKDQSKATGNAQNNAYPLDRFTVSTKNSGSNVDNKSPYFKSDAPSINLPKGGGAIKGIDEKFTINASNGTASLSIPLPITPGRSGFNPNLALQYNSGSGNSEFGLGWGIGVMSVQRKTDKKLPQYDDASESDVFLLAGAEDLLPKCDQDVSTWLPDIETVDGYVIKRYRPRIEGLFAKIECIRNVDNLQSWWKVTTKDNVVTFYGLSPEARIADPANELRVYKWLAQLSYDNKGNVMQYFYITDNDPETIPAAIHERNRKNGLSEWTNTYVKSIAYCNINSFTPSNEYQPTLTQKAEGGIETELFNAGYQMQLVFDYGNHNPSQPVPYDALTGMTVRKDPFSDFKAGFEIRTYRKCKRVLMYHYFTELLDESSYLLLSAPNIPSCLVSSLDLSYHHDDSEDSFVEVDMLQHVTPKGYKRNTGGTYRVKSKPQISIGYNGVIFRTELNSVSEGDVKNAPQGLTGQYHWIDLYGEGLQGILSEHGGSWYYKQNLGYGNFGSAVQVAPKPSVTGLGGEWQWQDLDGDGSRQLVSRSNILPGYFEFNDDQHWQTFKTFKKNINVDWNSPFTRLLDLDGDGRADVLISEDNIWRWYKNNGRDGIIEGGFSSVSFDEERAPRLLHNDKSQAIFLADMNGDGLTDIVRVRNGEVCYWPNIGYGKFGARVVMGNVPHFDTPDAFNAQSITIADVTATGAPDIVYIKPGKCTIWANLSGNVLGAGKDVYLPHMDQYTKIAVGDFLGKGTGCIVWSTQLPGQAASPLRYIDLFFGQKPYLINRIEQDLVKSISIQYKSSTYFYLEDRKAGKPWATRLPFPVHCVQEVITNDLVSSAKLVSTYSYHHGYYDHAEKEFRGFGRVDMLDAESAEGYNASSMALTYLNQPPVLTKTWYHTGAWMRNGTLLEAFANEYYPLDWAELATSPDITAASESQEIREAYRALKGQPLRQEIYAIDGTEQEGIPYTVTTNAYSVERIQPVLNNRFASFYSYKRETLTFSCERNENDPRVLHDLVLGLDKYGNILRSAKVAYPRRASAITAALADEDSPMPEYAGDVQARMLITYAETDYTNDTLSTAYRLRLPYQARNYELTGATPAGDVWTVSELITQIDHPSSAFISFTDTPTTGIQKRLVAHSRTTYLDDVCNALPLGTLGNIDLVHQKYTLVFDEGTVSGGSYYNDLVNDTILAEAGYVREDTITEFGSSVTTNFWLPGGRVYYMPASFYLPSSYIDPWGNITTITYWDAGTAYQLLPNTVTDELGNVTTANEYDWRCLQPSKITDINNNQSHVIYDTLCIPVAVAVMDKDGSTIGDTLLDLDPDSDDDLDLQDTFFSNPYSVAQDLLKGASWRCLYRWAKLEDTYRVSRIAMIAREQHNTDDPDSPLMIRITYADGFGRVAMEKILAAPEEGETTLRWITSGKTVYNNKGKAVMQYEPFFDTTHEFNTTYQAEEAGVTPRMYYDPLGRLFRTELPDGSYTKTEWTPWKNEIWDNNDTAADSDWYAAASLSTDTNLNDAATKTNDHIATPTVIYLDTLARPVCTIQHNRIDPEWDDEFYISHTVLDIQGNRLEIHDARELLTHSYKYNML